MSLLVRLPSGAEVLGVGVGAAVTVVGTDTWALDVGVVPPELEHAATPVSTRAAAPAVDRRADIRGEFDAVIRQILNGSHMNAGYGAPW
ncbi:hypothetical protein GCM10011492_40350 [Flexivirga endophytica]|uniref:Uncharacterized protein n=1 Tax=Flexivirga endophytica TaxID=1849103 RepID=A0A916THJ2_9MICO|nr:hypothetical protein GCM10011492_40350 [Flexivirga endophytica]GHB66786.1 hypothetical protein GCM10008112_39640 [Flexivirga endophytica]